MSHEVLMPKLGLTMTEGSVLEWKVQPGGVVRRGDVIVVIETDKVAFDVEAEVDGALLAIEVPEGQIVPVGTRIAQIAAADALSHPVTTEAFTPATSVMAATGRQVATPAAEAVASGPISSALDARVIATPYARCLAREAQLDLRVIEGSGPRGRIKAADVRKAVDAGEGRASIAHTASLAPAEAATQPVATPSLAVVDTHGERRRPSSIQATLARRLSEVKQGVPHFYLAAEAEISALESMRAKFNRDDKLPRLSLTTFIIAAVGRTLTDLPSANTIWDDGELVTFRHVDVGIAVNTPHGLFVPVVRDTGRQSIEQIAAASVPLIERAREGRLGLNDMLGGAITVSNAGMYNVTYMTPIVNPGQSAILGVGSIRAVFRPDAAGNPVLRHELGLVLAADHRIFDGVSGLAVLNGIIAYLEAPWRLLVAGLRHNS